MWKFGITNIEQLEGKPLDLIAGEKRRISITLYEQAAYLENSDAIAERILFDFADERRAFKRTYFKRFEEFDKEVISFLVKLHPIASLHDFGVSDGRTALDFFELTSQFFPSLEYLASDISGSIFVVEERRLKIAMNKKCELLEVVYPPFVFNVSVRESRLRYPINALAYSLIRSLLVQPLISKIAQQNITPRKVLLFSPSVMKKARESRRFKLAQQNILDPFPDRVDVVRAMNVLNPTYFTADEFDTSLRNIYNSLNPNGVLITGSNQNAGTAVNGAMYIKRNGTFERLRVWGEGSPIDEVISGIRG